MTNAHLIIGNWPVVKGVPLATATHSTREDFHVTSLPDSVSAMMDSVVAHVMIVLMVSMVTLTDSVTLANVTLSDLPQANATVLLDSVLALMVPVVDSVTNVSVDSLELCQTVNHVVNALTTGMPSLMN